MNIVRKKLSELRHPEVNARLHPEKQIAEFKRSLDQFEQIRPLVIDEKGVIWVGNGLYEAMVSMGWTEADCHVVTGLSEKAKKKLMLADNRLYSLGVDDLDAFDTLIAELGNDLDVPGYDEDLLRTLSANVNEIDDMLADYGKITGDQRESMEAAAAVKREQEAQEDSRASAAVREAPKQGDGQYIVCPNCGEKIWL